MANDKAALDNLIAPLRRKYLMQLGEWLKEAELLLPKLRNAQCSQQQLDALKVKAHNLAGTGASYGFKAVSEAGKAFETGMFGYQRYNAEESTRLLEELIAASLQAVDTLGGENAEGKSGTESDAVEDSSQQKPLLLIADDDVSVRELLYAVLKDDAEILTAASGDEAWTIIRQRKPDFAILDDLMPGDMSGIELLEKIKHDPEFSYLPIVMLTSRSKPLEVMRGAMFGAAEYLTKPFNAAEVARKMQVRFKRRKTTILIADADDDITARQLLAHKFSQSGINAILADSGARVLEVARTTPLNLIILDYTTPKMNGMTLVNKLREIPTLQTAPILFITANSHAATIKEGQAAIAADCIIRPFVPGEVVARCLRLLNTDQHGEADGLAN